MIFLEAPTRRVRRQIIAGNLIRISPASITFITILTCFTSAFNLFGDISEIRNDMTGFQNISQRFFSDISNRHIYARAWLYVSL